MILKLAQAFALARKYRVELKLMTLPDGGGAPEGRRERKIGSFCRKTFGFSGLSKFSLVDSLACRTFGNPPYLSLSGSAAAPPSGGAKTWPYRAARRNPVRFAGLCCWAGLGHGPCVVRCLFRNAPSLSGAFHSKKPIDASAAPCLGVKSGPPQRLPRRA